MRLFKTASIFFLFFLLTACVNTKVVDIKSPCVSSEDGPCGPRKPVNVWLKEYQI